MPYLMPYEYYTLYPRTSTVRYCTLYASAHHHRSIAHRYRASITSGECLFPCGRVQLADRRKVQHSAEILVGNRSAQQDGRRRASLRGDGRQRLRGVAAGGDAGREGRCVRQELRPGRSPGVQQAGPKSHVRTGQHNRSEGRGGTTSPWLRAMAIVPRLCRHCSLDRPPMLIVLPVAQFAQVVDDLCEGADCVWHIAALVGPFHNKDMYFKVNYEGTLNIINSCKKHKVPRPSSLHGQPTIAMLDVIL